MSERADFTHCQKIGPFPSAAEQRASLAAIVATSRAKEAAREAQYQRVAKENHLALMERFRERIKTDDCFTEEEKADIMRRSFEWCDGRKSSSVGTMQS